MLGKPGHRRCDTRVGSVALRLFACHSMLNVTTSRVFFSAGQRACRPGEGVEARSATSWQNSNPRVVQPRGMTTAWTNDWTIDAAWVMGWSAVLAALDVVATRRGPARWYILHAIANVGITLTSIGGMLHAWRDAWQCIVHMMHDAWQGMVRVVARCVVWCTLHGIAALYVADTFASFADPIHSMEPMTVSPSGRLRSPHPMRMIMALHLYHMVAFKCSGAGYFCFCLSET